MLLLLTLSQLSKPAGSCVVGDDWRSRACQLPNTLHGACEPASKGWFTAHELD